MMKFTQAINVAVASVLVVPAVTLQGGGAQSLRDSLDSTLLALETLAGIDRRLEEGLPEAVEEVLESTEPSIAVAPEDPGARDRLLESLRNEVGVLQARFDQAQRDATGTEASAPVLPLAHSAGGPVTTGLDDEMRALLSSKPVRPVVLVPVEPQATAAVEADKVTFEQEGFTADPLRLGQAYYRKGDFERALAILEQQESAEAVYWKARSLEKLGEHEAAVAAYTAVSEMEHAGPLASRALEDIEFLNWRLEFEGKQPR